MSKPTVVDELVSLIDPQAKHEKVLTSKNKRATLVDVKAINKRKDDKMASNKTQKNSKGSVLKAVVWSAFAAHQGFVGWLVITNFDNYFAVVSAVASFTFAVVSIAMVGANVSKVLDK